MDIPIGDVVLVPVSYNFASVSFSPGIPNVGSKGESNLKGFNQHHVNQIPQQQLNIYITSVLCQ
jgi:hypothetical protein